MSARSPSGGEPLDPRPEALSSDERSSETNGHAPSSAEVPGDVSEEGVLLQQVMRFRNADGTESIYATLRGEIAAHQRGITLYVGFCPPFSQLPVVEAEAIEGPPALVTVAQVQNNGAQIDVRLEQPALQATEVMVEVAALPSKPEPE